MKRSATLIIAICCLLSFAAKAQTEATFYTSMGSFVVTFEDAKVPRTVDSFKARIHNKFYDGLIFHRVISGFMIQGGDPSGNGSGGPGYYTPDEIVSGLNNVPAAVAMANAGPNTNGSQFYVNLVNNSHLNGSYTVVGTVTTGFSVVQAIGQVSTTGSTGNPKDKPLTDVVMDSVRITKFATNVNNVIKPENIASIYPNPSTDGKFTIAINNPNITTQIIVTDVAGKQITQLEVTQQTQAGVDLSSQPKGVYLIQLSNTDGIQSSKVTVR